jgi:type IV pilus assembly protein PilB
MLLVSEQHRLHPSEHFDAVYFVQKLLREAVEKGASDIHFEPYETGYRIRLRIDGILIGVDAPPLHCAARISAHIKVLANLDVSERRLPQDGGFRMRMPQSESLDVRVTTCPVSSGEKVVIRLQDLSKTQPNFSELGFYPTQENLFLKAINKPQGMILVTGPTGCGKTKTLYSALNYLNKQELNISTAEDPVEIQLPGINQVAINAKIGLDFGQTLRSILRQDPDVIMLGEIRDLETAQVALRAAQTGHLVLSTLHTNSASKAIDRLRDLGAAGYLLADSLTLIVAQRLVRKVCVLCNGGCTECTRGYKGRIGVFETLVISQALSELIHLGATSSEILKKARAEGMRTIYETGLERVKEGVTTIEEVNRVTAD